MRNLFIRVLHNLNRFRLWLTRPLTLGVRLILIKDESILLVKHTYQNLWFLPGGGVEKGETLEQAIRREAQEEIGAQLSDLSLLGVYTNFFEFKSDHVAVFICQNFRLSPQNSPEIAACQFFPLNQLPADLAAGHQRRVVESQRGQNSPYFGLW